jgi:hypothetical protein
MTVITTRPPPEWQDICETRGLLFHSSDWQAVLEQGFNAESLYIWDKDDGEGAAVTIFRAGPFRIGYLGFPFGGTLSDRANPEHLVTALRQTAGIRRPAALRVPVSAFGSSRAPEMGGAATPETAISDLQAWRLEQLSRNMQRDIRQAQRSGLELADIADPGDADQLHALYEATVQRHQGAVRYTAAYFRSLVELAGRHAGIRVLVARLEDAVAAFAVFVKHGPLACYLHGATNQALRKHQPAALLLQEGITWAQGNGCEVFNLMSSPPGQESLVRYKERWGGETREHGVYTLGTSAAYPLFRFAESIHQRLGR